MQKLIVALTLLFGGIAANDRDGHSRLLRGRGTQKIEQTCLWAVSVISIQ